jgi:hypothetical protein
MAVVLGKELGGEGRAAKKIDSAQTRTLVSSGPTGRVLRQ